MDADRFDILTRSLTAAGSRRRALGGLLSGTLGLLGLAHPDDAAAGGKCKPTCGDCATCKKGKCRKTKHGKTCKKGKCQPLREGTPCTAGTCRGGICAAPPPPPPCTNGIKDGNESDVDCGGGCKRCANGQTCKTRNDCASNVCTGGTCQACPDDVQCGDPEPTTCVCRQTEGQGVESGVCTEKEGTLPPGDDCALCPADTTCEFFITQNHCFPRCGAA